MAKKIQGEKFEQPVQVSAKDVIRDPEISMETKVYPVGEQAYAILKQGDCVDWLSPIAFASLGLFLTQVCSLIAYFFQIYIHFEDTEEVAQLKESQEHGIGMTMTILFLSLAVFVVLLIISKFVPTKKKKLLKKIRKVLDEDPSIIASKSKGKTSD